MNWENLRNLTSTSLPRDFNLALAFSTHTLNASPNYLLHLLLLLLSLSPRRSSADLTMRNVHHGGRGSGREYRAPSSKFTLHSHRRRRYPSCKRNKCAISFLRTVPMPLPCDVQARVAHLLANLGWVDFSLDVTLPAQLCWGLWELGS